jgi:ketosteroid isomerase-like protein
MAGELEGVVQEFMQAFDRMDIEAIKAQIASDAQGIDEMSRRWMRTREDIGAYLGQLEGAVSDVHSELRDVDESRWDDTGIVTFWLEQEYTLDGERHQISAPTTVVLRREGGDWKLALFHSVPLAEGASA